MSDMLMYGVNYSPYRIQSFLLEDCLFAVILMFLLVEQDAQNDPNIPQVI